MLKIEKVYASEILDSRGHPTISSTVVLSDGSVGVGFCPSGASTGKYEAHEKRDGDKNRYGGKGVLTAVQNVDNIIAPALKSLNCVNLQTVDKTMIDLDGSENKSNLGANAMLSVSMATVKALAAHYKMPLFRYIGGVSACKMPIPMMNILNGGAHASNNIDIQEFMIMPIGAKDFKEMLRACSEIYHNLGAILKSKGFSTAVGDEGGFAPNLSSDEEAIELIISAIEKSGYDTNYVKIALDAAGNEWVKGEDYFLPKRKKTYTVSQMIDYWKNLVSSYPILSLEDPLGEEDFDGWAQLTAEIGDKVQIVGDDLFVTNKKRLEHGAKTRAANAILIKPNQIGTVSETLETIILAKTRGYKSVISHRSGETEDAFIADLAVAVNSGQIKTGAPCRSERLAKYNRLIRIMESIC